MIYHISGGGFWCYYMGLGCFVGGLGCFVGSLQCESI